MICSTSWYPPWAQNAVRHKIKWFAKTKSPSDRISTPLSCISTWDFFGGFNNICDTGHLYLSVGKTTTRNLIKTTIFCLSFSLAHFNEWMILVFISYGNSERSLSLLGSAGMIEIQTSEKYEQKTSFLISRFEEWSHILMIFVISLPGISNFYCGWSWPLNQDVRSTLSL